MTVTRKSKSKGKALTAKQSIVLAALCAGKKKSEAAREAGICPQAVSEMLRAEHFVNALQTWQDAFREAARDQLEAVMLKSLAVMSVMLDADNAALRFRAAAYFLDRILPPAQGKRGVLHEPAVSVMPAHGETHSTGAPNVVQKALQQLDDHYPDDNVPSS